MGELFAAAPVAGLSSRDRIDPEDVLLLRREVFRDGVVTRGEAEALLALDASRSEKCAEWPIFLVEAITDFIVHQEAPAGYISADNANWLIDAISRDGVVNSLTELELLIHALEKARSAPEHLSAYALSQVAQAVTEGSGPLVKGGKLTPGLIDRAEVELLRRILFAFGGGGNSAITRAEADVLFSINDRTVEEMNDPAWSELFVKAIGSHVLAGSGYQPASREEALRHEALFEMAEVDIGGFFGRMVSGGVSGILKGIAATDGLDNAWAERNAAREGERAAAAHVNETEARWLAEKIGRDRLMHENERVLLAFIRREAASVHPELMPLIDKVA